MSAKPIGKMIGGMLGGMLGGTSRDPAAPEAREAAGSEPEAGQTGAQSQAMVGADNEVAAAAPGATAETATDAPAAQQAEPTQIDLDVMEERLIDAMRTVYDPEIPVDIYELGLIYSLRVRPGGKVDIEMTLTTPNCPVAGSMPGMVENVARMVEGVTDVHVELVWEPIWNPEMMSEAARLQLNMY